MASKSANSVVLIVCGLLCLGIFMLGFISGHHPKALFTPEHLGEAVMSFLLFGGLCMAATGFAGICSRNKQYLAQTWVGVVAGLNVLAMTILLVRCVFLLIKK